MASGWWIVAALAVAAAPAQTPDAAAVAAGRKIYTAEKCFTCHQVAGQGNQRFPLDGVGSRLTAAEIRRWFTHTAEMEARLPRRPAIRMSAKTYKFSAIELDALVAYLRSLKAPGPS